MKRQKSNIKVTFNIIFQLLVFNEQMNVNTLALVLTFTLAHGILVLGKICVLF